MTAGQLQIVRLCDHKGRVALYACVASVAVVVLAVLCVVGVLVGQKLRKMRRGSSMVRKPHILRGGGQWCATCEQIHRLIGEAMYRLNKLPPDEKPEATRREPNESATGKPYPENVKPHRVN
jgi:hypothetical protein